MEAQKQDNVAKLLQRVNPGSFSLAEHSYRRFDVDLPDGIAPEDIENPKLWELVSGKLREGYEIRAVGFGYQWVAYLFVTFVSGTSVGVKVIHGANLEMETDIPTDNIRSDYEVKLCGKKRWCVIKVSTGEAVKEGIAKKHEAERELDDLVRALKS